MASAKVADILFQPQCVNSHEDVCVMFSEMDIAVLGVHNAQKSAQLALHGKYTSSRMNALMGQRLVARQA